MENTDLMLLWKEQNHKIEQSLQINKQLLRDNLNGKVRSVLSGSKSTRIIGIVFGILWCVLMSFIVIVSWDKTNWFFKSAIIIHIIASMSAVGLYCYHLMLMQNLDHNQSILQAQKQLSKLQLSNLKTLGILWLQLPVFSMWFMSTEWMRNDPTTFWFLQTPIVVVQGIIGFWLYKNLHIKNQNKKWFRWFMSKGEFGRIKKANEFLKEMENLN